MIAPNWVGDVVMSTPFLSLLRRSNSGDFITVLCREYVSELLRRSPQIDTLLTYRRADGIRGAIGSLRRARPEGGWDECYVLPLSFSSALIAFMSGSGKRTGYRTWPRSVLLTDRLDRGGSRSVHLSREYAVLAGTGEEEIPAPCVLPPYDWKERVEKLGIEGRYAVFAAGATYGPAKVWPGDRFAETASAMAERFELGIVIAGGRAERDYLESIREITGGINLAGRTDMGDLMALLRGAAMVVGNDSGPVHVSAAMGVPTVAIFGSTSPAWTAPGGGAVRVVSTQADCSPCFEKECPEGDTHCLTELDAGKVLSAVSELMKAGEA